MSADGLWPTYRSVALDSAAEAFVDLHAVPGARFEDHWNGIVWLISRTPDVGLPRDRHNPQQHVLLVSAGSDLAGTREVWLLYSYDDDKVIVHAVRYAEE